MGLGWVCELLNYIPHFMAMEGEGYLLFINNNHFRNIMYCRNCALRTVSKILGIFNMARGVFIFIIFVGKKRILLQVGFKDILKSASLVPIFVGGGYSPIWIRQEVTRQRLHQETRYSFPQVNINNFLFLVCSSCMFRMDSSLSFHANVRLQKSETLS